MSTHSDMPTCIGFIMDGNRRWAIERSLNTFEGHKKGTESFSETIRFVREHQIPHAVFYAFSTENWKRSKVEVEYLMHLAFQHLKELKDKLVSGDPDGDPEVGVRFRFIGDIERFRPKLQKLIREVEADTAEYTDTTVWIALSYSGRAEIMEALNEAVKRGEPLTEESFKALMWSREMPDPDLIVRTGGEQRLSNFLTWQSAYSELVFLTKYWPDVTADDLDSVLREYQQRNRRFGK